MAQSTDQGTADKSQKSLLEWTQEYSVGVEKFDEQHRRLFELINELHAAMRQGQGKTVLESVLENLASYTIDHFSDEESVFARCSYPDIFNHRKEHAALIEKVNDLTVKFRQDQTLISIAVLNFLKEWIENHIKVSDKAYTAYLNSHGVR